MGVSNIISENPWDLRDVVWTKTAGSVATDGVYMKAEKCIDGVNHYLKLSNYDSYRGIFGHESVNELIAERLGAFLGFNMPEGFLNHCLVTLDSRDFDSFVYAAKSFRTSGSRWAFDGFYVDNRLSPNESPLDFCRRFGWTDEIYKMFIFDYLIINRDRHGANLEVMKNGEKRLSPLFDNGISFVCTCLNSDEVAAFNKNEDRPVNNFIGEKRLALNLKHIDKPVVFNELKESHRAELFKGLSGILPDSYYETIWDIIRMRWEDVKEFRVA